MTSSQMIEAFQYHDSRTIRTMLIDGEVWFVARDVCDVLGYRMSSDATRVLKDRQKGTHLVRTPGGDQRVSIISESGLYKLIMRSNKPEAEAFQDWVTEVVLPSIRKTGRYEVDSPNLMADLLTGISTKLDEVLVNQERLTKDIEINSMAIARMAAAQFPAPAVPVQRRPQHLTEAIVSEARRQARAGFPITRLAKRYGVPYGTLYGAVRGRTFRNIAEPPVDSQLDSQEFA
jgi:prophage antirepressor-like protein